ncbi:MAG: acetolactate synthase large subunit [Alphaproteobacteria bacterium]|nr:acetolactate synthase large subunit [Alphaproteobacteria bacterium]
MNGAERLIETLLEGGVEVSFMNPGTSEIHLVKALDRASAFRAVPCLFEGVASGAADGYARMTGKPASTLFHLGPGLSNALANLHNAYRARVPMVNVVGEHASFHRKFDAPLTSDIEAIARPYSGWLRTTRGADDMGRDCLEAIAAAKSKRGQIATLIVPADAAWSDAAAPSAAPPPMSAQAVETGRIEIAADMLRNGIPTAILLGPHLSQGRPLLDAGGIAAATGASLLTPFAFTRMERGRDLPSVERIPYVTSDALALLARFGQLILVGASAPAAFFGHPERPSSLVPKDCRVEWLAEPHEDCEGALSALAAMFERKAAAPARQEERPSRPSGEITIPGLAAAVAAVLPEGAIVVDESITSGRGMLAATKAVPRHDWLVNTGGSIGIGIPLAVGAAIACPDRPVLCLEADGSALYTMQALWTAARERLRITTVLFANRAYQILKGELGALGNPGPRALATLDLGHPDIDFVALARGLGMAATRVGSLDEFAATLHRSLAGSEPQLIEVPL